MALSSQRPETRRTLSIDVRINTQNVHFQRLTNNVITGERETKHRYGGSHPVSAEAFGETFHCISASVDE